jgi:hypothetical protein
MTIHDMIDAMLVAFAAVAWLRSGNVAFGWSVGGLIMVHLVGRLILTDFNEPVPMLAVGFTGMSIAFLLSRVLSFYGQVAGSVFGVMSVACWLSAMSGNVSPPQDGGLALDLWNFLSIGLHVVGITLIFGIVRHGSLATDRIYRDRR